MNEWEDATHLFRGPQTAWVYRFLGAGGEVLYVGQTSRWPAERFRGHVRDSQGKRASAYGTWFPLVVRAETLEVPSLSLDAIEAALIHHWHPRGNCLCPSCNYYDEAQRVRAAATRAAKPAQASRPPGTRNSRLVCHGCKNPNAWVPRHQGGYCKTCLPDHVNDAVARMNG